ncbi:type VI secretion system-associated protein TagF [Sphingomonas alpina]|uniref:Type VI secretion system-associated protein TagF n=1 Tax=Sphingomonas alpina TaxID=653931 RepID=A0A7H0LIS0_9SPHN|nr:type VI secretion system-associated protein TagF [Sphingomonas alpina]QNQ09573.1 type VI secretion system-associated protein TagF [Sphingomonas alpina]
MSGVALFGKLPAHGDFVARGFTHDQREQIDAWLSPSLAQARADLGEAFADTFDRALPWRCEGNGIAGAVAASQDALGRRFPILLLIGDPAAAARCEALLYAAIGERWEADRLVREAGDAADALVIHAADRWWSADGDTEAATLDGACPPILMSAMLTRSPAS